MPAAAGPAHPGGHRHQELQARGRGGAAAAEEGGEEAAVQQLPDAEEVQEDHLQLDGMEVHFAEDVRERGQVDGGGLNCGGDVPQLPHLLRNCQPHPRNHELLACLHRRQERVPPRSLQEQLLKWHHLHQQAADGVGGEGGEEIPAVHLQGGAQAQILRVVQADNAGEAEDPGEGEHTHEQR